ncbi:MAG: ATP/GTP-binding protein, partial [Deltaproteobacteria bacterium]|nr:ATP/GTP-binding protein [Deltaproteobacteria bacterium]
MDIRKLAKLISGIESREKSALQELSDLVNDMGPSGGNVRVIGITGPPGAGKSTIVDGMIKILRQNGAKVGVVAIDPSSPFSGGAILGDRIRMQEHASDKGVFIRSVGSRGSHGGLSSATRDIVRAISAFGFDYVIVET